MQKDLTIQIEMARQLYNRLQNIQAHGEYGDDPNLATDIFTAFGASFDLSYELRKAWLELTELPAEDESPDAIISGPMVGGPMTGWNQRTQTWDSAPVENPFQEGELALTPMDIRSAAAEGGYLYEGTCEACGRVAMLSHGLCEGCTIEGMME